MTKLIITENLISDINQIKSEINIDESIVSISQEEFTANNTAALFQSDNFQFVSDSFVTEEQNKKSNILQNIYNNSSNQIGDTSGNLTVGEWGGFDSILKFLDK